MAAAKRTIRRAVEHEIAKRKGSRFITAVCPLDGPGEMAHEQVRAVIDSQRAKFPSACHHCFGFTTADGRELCSDDGEPHGTAGRPILSVLQRADLVDVAVVVSRIFGGTKLGTGGLIRAYGAAAQEALEAAEVVDMVPTAQLQVVAAMAHIDAVKHGVAKFEAQVVAQEFAMDAVFTLRVPTHQVEAFASYLGAKSAGKISVEEV